MADSNKLSGKKSGPKRMRFEKSSMSNWSPPLREVLFLGLLFCVGCSTTVSRMLLPTVRASTAVHTAIERQEGPNDLIEWVSILPGVTTEGATKDFQKDAKVIATGNFNGWGWRVKALEPVVANHFEAAFAELAASSDKSVLNLSPPLESWNAVFENLYFTSANLMAMEPPDVDLELLLVPEGFRADYRSLQRISNRTVVEIAIDITGENESASTDLYIRDLMRIMAITGSQIHNLAFMRGSLPAPLIWPGRRLKMEANSACWLTSVRRSFFLGYQIPVRPRPPQSIDSGGSAMIRGALQSEYEKRPDDLHLAQLLGLLILLEAQEDAARAGALSFPQSGIDASQIASEVRFCKDYIALAGT